jgi:hypothetical protein
MEDGFGAGGSGRERTAQGAEGCNGFRAGSDGAVVNGFEIIHRVAGGALEQGDAGFGGLA